MRVYETIFLFYVSVDTTAKVFYTDPIPVANCVRVFIAKLKEIDAWHIG